MKVHIIGIGGTFMSALALLARDAGFNVTGCDENCYPPVSDLLADKGIDWVQGYDNAELALSADMTIIGNVAKRGMPVVEAVLNANKPYASGPEWLARHILSRYRVIGVAGTHGKTTTTSMLAYILEYAGKKPGFLIGGVAQNFNTSAALGEGDWFVIESDEYDSAFFDKRPKFMHYRPDVAVINNLEHDHADIYPNLAAIQQQFHYLIRTIPEKGTLLVPRDDTAISEVLSLGVYSHIEEMACNNQAVWRAEILQKDGSHFRVFFHDAPVAEVTWPLIGQFNVENGLAAIAASYHADVSPEIAAEALQKFIPVKRRLEKRGAVRDITIYDDFAHHPTAIAKTIEATKDSSKHQRVVVVVEFASFSMRTGVHAKKMADALAKADAVFVLKPANFSLEKFAEKWQVQYQILSTTEALVKAVSSQAISGDAILVMSNRGFDDIHQRILASLRLGGSSN